MPSAEDITEAVNRYLETVSQGRPDDIAALYADDATIEDPVGSDVHIGQEAIRGFYKAVEGANATTEMVTLRVLGSEAAYFWRLMIGGMTIEIISVMTFNEDAKIASMKAYWGPDNITQG
ncbi:nuclear transport factor 2 family protein [Mycolicibacterium moriokaense]|uniref:Steroid delta-isomerase n=1 Tax=Mycolicibacterium moriokaense TaxID=39691 RepID=A0A318HGP7_9MYCO|nr:nuclear transport factor 2 family protein [Mycolicibacterium moriokaense]PXX08781.1 steroid delta-isomerase [Mycolicibacterium moriokaense]